MPVMRFVVVMSAKSRSPALSRQNPGLSGMSTAVSSLSVLTHSVARDPRL